MCVLSRNPVDLKPRKSTSTSCQIEFHFSIQIIKFLMKYNLLCLQISGRLINFFIKESFYKFQQVSQRKKDISATFTLRILWFARRPIFT